MTMATIVVDLQFGSTGKGLISGFLSCKEDFDAVVCANQPNAGHTFVDQHGTAWIHKALPSGIFSPSLKYVMIGPGAVFDLNRLAVEAKRAYDELPNWENVTIVIHECASLLRGDHVSKERAGLNHISSTMQGSMEATYEKLQRGLRSNVVKYNKEAVLEAVEHSVVVTSSQWLRRMMAVDNLLVEGSQGYSLGIDAGFYPYCTSRNCTVDRVMSECAVPGLFDRHVVGAARVHPIRVGDTIGGTSGPCYPDQRETDWETLGQKEEYTTVTKRVRRVFSFSEQQIEEAITMNAVNDVFLNFCNYNPTEAIRVKDIINAIGEGNIENEFNFGPVARVKYMGFGPRADQVLVL